MSGEAPSWKKRRGRQRRRQQNVHLEANSDHSDSESDDSDAGDRTDRPKKKSCREDHSTDGDSEGRNVDNQSNEADSDDARHSDHAENQSDESPSQNSSERNEDPNIEDNIGNHRNCEDDEGGDVNNQAADDGVDDNVDEGGDFNNQAAHDGEDNNGYYNHIDSPARSIASDIESSAEGSLNSDQSEAEVSDSDREDSDNSRSGSESENEDEDEEEGEDEEEAMNNRPIYNGAQINFKESLLAILTFILTHKLTGLCVSDLLSLIILHCGANNICLTSLYRFKNYFKMIGRNFIICHYYCSECEISLANKNSICAKCQNPKNIAYFIEFPIVTQLQSLIETKKNNRNIEDIYDGRIYKHFTTTGFLSNPNNISFFMYFDGIALFKSSTFSIWPVYLTINELKYKERTRKENTIIAGIWFGKSKPNPNLFLVPMEEKLTTLESDGVDLQLPNGGSVRVKGKLLGAVGDMPAKAAFMRLRQYNGAFSCFHCMEQGGRFDVGRTTVQVFPYNKNFRLRKRNETIRFGELAVAARQADPDASVYGVKGPTLLSIMLPNIIYSMGQDVMHGIFLGVMKTLASFWFDSQYSDFPFSISAFVNVVDRRLKCIKPPFSFQRFPRSLAKEFAQFKASDWKIFFFFYSLPALIGILPHQYWLHHLKLVNAISVLCQESISMEEIITAEEILHSYVAEFEGLYGVRHLSLTFHQLLHLPLVVRNLGPAWVYSCFFYESLNGELRQLVHGSKHVALQICSSSCVFMNLTVMVNSLPEGRVKQFCLKVQQKGALKVKITENIDHQSAVVGKLVNYVNVPDLYIRLLTETFNVNGGLWKYFLRLKVKGSVFTSESYERSERKLSCFVEIVHDNIPYLCKINSFVKWTACYINCPPNCDCQKLYICFVTVYNRVHWEIHEADMPVFVSYLNKVTPTNEIRAFPVNSIKSACLYMPLDTAEYMALPINNLEVE
ncbi:Halomucin [Frankliniella fusca]|uniref:Halomucin n=1 Tax=Frankliniella fusca TaxID=407009 RepID=A0AAE1LEX1_9NEOP|nr:Halomucin [Frankliniella fusca]